ncbi:hypothetical protein [Hyphomicrobium sp. ghe19]|uniref:hypothetical protein n=1 Tax=Hyphomicrobium sp. ghe19 TaxID=2682968 RepID=UPI0013670DD5|nr:hypothetical protein HYPP_02444 [Hyphomicrobium sp. ghe19]
MMEWVIVYLWALGAIVTLLHVADQPGDDKLFKYLVVLALLWPVTAPATLVWSLIQLHRGE